MRKGGQARPRCVARRALIFGVCNANTELEGKGASGRGAPRAVHDGGARARHRIGALRGRHGAARQQPAHKSCPLACSTTRPLAPPSDASRARRGRAAVGRAPADQQHQQGHRRQYQPEECARPDGASAEAVVHTAAPVVSHDGAQPRASSGAPHIGD
eukprot:scaffold8069_cov126-Isochrysis_galbana.AAC.5